jgi:hypothetical protein
MLICAVLKTHDLDETVYDIDLATLSTEEINDVRYFFHSIHTTIELFGQPHRLQALVASSPCQYEILSYLHCLVNNQRGNYVGKCLNGGARPSAFTLLDSYKELSR